MTRKKLKNSASNILESEDDPSSHKASAESPEFMKKVLITGISGFAGSFLAEELLKKNFEIYGTYLFDKSLANVVHIKDKLNLIKLDLLSYENVLEEIKKIKPEIVFHLAAIAATSQSFKNPSEIFTNNVASQLNLLEAIRLSEINPRILIVSSAEVYGAVSKENLPIDEETPLRPLNTYAVSKLSQDFLGLQYFLTYKMDITRVRPSNHIGPRQSPNFVVSDFAKKIAEVESGGADGIKVGNLETKRDFTDVRDMVKAYALFIDLKTSGEVYNLGSGKSYSISEILDKLIKLSKVSIKVEVDKSLFRPSDNPELICDSSKFRQLSGWKPEIDIDKTLKNTLEYWRRQKV